MKTWILALAMLSNMAAADQPASVTPAEACGRELGYVELKYMGTDWKSSFLIANKLKLSFESDPLTLDLYTDHGDNHTVRLNLESLTRFDEIYRAFPFHSHQIKPKGCIDEAQANCDITDLRLELDIAAKSLVVSSDPAEAERDRKAIKCAERMVDEFGKRVARELERRKASVLIKE